MRRLALALALALVGPSLACESRAASRDAPQPDPSHPSEPPSEPPPSEPPPSEPAPLELVAGEAAGIHYVELVTGDASPEAALPMIVAIHGLGDTPENFAELFVGFDRPARVILPRGLDPQEGGWSWFPFRAASPDVDALAQSIAGAADRLAPAIAELHQRRPSKGKPIVTGFSQGGMLTLMLAVEHSEQVGHAIAIGGWLPPPRWPQTKPPADAPTIVALHGDIDKAVAFAPTKQAVEHLAALGWPAELHGYPNVGHAIPPAMRGEFFALLRSYID
ncbi:alpha/beta hydrolase [Nannocystaceae bacterium ST9]